MDEDHLSNSECCPLVVAEVKRKKTTLDGSTTVDLVCFEREYTSTLTRRCDDRLPFDLSLKTKPKHRSVHILGLGVTTPHLEIECFESREGSWGLYEIASCSFCNSHEYKMRTLSKSGDFS